MFFHTSASRLFTFYHTPPVCNLIFSNVRNQAIYIGCHYYFKMSIDVNDEDALTCFLKDESTVMMVCARNNVCISFQ